MAHYRHDPSCRSRRSSRRNAHLKALKVANPHRSVKQRAHFPRPDTWTGALDRSPCGTGTCAKMATLHAKGKLPLNKDFRHEGILGTIFTGRLVKETQVGPYPAVVPTVTGRAWITHFSTYVLDPDDPFPRGFTVGDIWGHTD
ncbi:MAG TPA: hypothetical protein ENL11_00295 [Candidatus Acetothermia bacterium]|nr:hypothetical protein [Candidatus Acetothermia bacterium]